MSEETTRCDLFDRWERVWHEEQYDRTANCIGPIYIRQFQTSARPGSSRALATKVQIEPHGRNSERTLSRQ